RKHLRVEPRQLCKERDRPRRIRANTWYRDCPRARREGLSSRGARGEIGVVWSTRAHTPRALSTPRDQQATSERRRARDRGFASSGGKRSTKWLHRVVEDNRGP